MAKFCNKCGTPLTEGVHFCPNCGNSITEVNPPVAAPSKQSSTKKFQILFISLILIVVLFFGIKGISHIIPEKKANITGRWEAITERPFGMAFHDMYFPKDMEFFTDNSFTEYHSDDIWEGEYVLSDERLKITEFMSPGTRDRVWHYDCEIKGNKMTLTWETGTSVTYERID